MHCGRRYQQGCLRVGPLVGYTMWQTSSIRSPSRWPAGLLPNSKPNEHHEASVLDFPSFCMSYHDDADRFGSCALHASCLLRGSISRGGCGNTPVFHVFVAREISGLLDWNSCVATRYYLAQEKQGSSISSRSHSGSIAKGRSHAYVLPQVMVSAPFAR